MGLIKDIKNISKLTNNKSIFVGGVCSMLNDENYKNPIKDIDIMIDISMLDKLKVFGNIKELKPNKIYGLEIKRFYIDRDSFPIDIFIQNSDYTTETLIGNVKIKHLSLEGQKRGLSKIIENLNKINKNVLLKIYENKLNKLCV